MPMNIASSQNLLTKAVAIATLSLSIVTLSPTYAAISMDPAEKAALVEQRLAHINEQTNLMLERMTQSPLVEDVAVTQGELTHDEANQSATATGELVITFNDDYIDEDSLKDNAIAFGLNDHVNYSDALNQEDILARVDTSIELKNASEILDELSADEQKEVLSILEGIELRTDLLDGSKVKQSFTFPTLDLNDGDESNIAFGGFTIESMYDEDTIAQGIGGEHHIDVKQLIVSELQEDIDYEALMELPQEQQESLSYEDYPMVEEKVEVVNLEPFTMDFDISDEGEINLDSSPIVMHFDNQEGGLLIERVTGEGNISYDKDIAQYLGKQHYTAHNVAIESTELPAPVVFDTVELVQNLDRSGDLYNSQGQFIFTPNATSFDALTDGMFAVKSIDMGFTAQNFSKDAIEQLMSLDALVVGDDLEITDDNRALIKSLISSLSNDDATLAFNFALNTDKGNVTTDANVHLREGADAQAWTDALNHEDSDALQQLVSNDLLFDAKLAVPVSLLDAVGMTEMAEMMGAPYVVREGGNLTVHVQNKGDGPLVNGQSLDAIEAGM